MCRGSNLGPCCAVGCSEQIRCRDTGGYCDQHDPNDWLTPEVADDPEKRRAYTAARLTEGISAAERTIRAEQLSLSKMRSRLKELA